MKKIICLFTFILLIFFVSCNSKSSSKKEKITINIVGSYDNFEALEAEFDRFNEIYPDVILQYTKIDDYDNTIATVLEGKSKPNIFFSSTKMFENEEYDTVVSHMEDLSNSSLKIDLNCIRDGLINHYSDKVLMVPVFSRTYGMLINDDLFKKENINIPTTLAELKDACNSFKEKGYISPMMGYTKDSSSSLMNTIAYPLFLANLKDNPEAITLANNLDPSAGEYMRSALNNVKMLFDDGLVDLTECDKIKDNYGSVILRFFEGDVPMMICQGDTVSGTKKRESQSKTFINSPFNYSFSPIPLTDEGGYFIDSPSIEFSVNKDCDNLDMTNKFMKFLITSKELNEMASIKLLYTPTKEIPSNSLYQYFNNVPGSRTISPELLGIKDSLATQTRIAAYRVGKGELTVDEAVNKYGSLK